MDISDKLDETNHMVDQIMYYLSHEEPGRGLLQQVDRLEFWLQVLSIAAVWLAAVHTFSLIHMAMRAAKFFGCVLAVVLVAGGSAQAAIMVDILETKCDQGNRNLRVWLWDSVGGAIGNATFSISCDGTETGNFSGSGLPLGSGHMAAIRAVAGGPCANCSDVGPPCPPIDTGLIGLNCCPVGESGATYFQTVNSKGCPVLACASFNCDSNCPPPPSGTEGSACNCGDGTTGTLVYTYDENGCPNGTFCDDCELCDPVEQGNPCTCEDGGTGRTSQGPDDSMGCPTEFCDCLGVDCNADENENGIPDSQEDNPYQAKEEGESCTCEGGERDGGTIVIENDENGCPQPRCKCECQDKGGDADGDGCCDDEDPDPEDESKDCKSCEDHIQDRFQLVIAKFANKVGLQEITVEDQEWEFGIDTSSLSSDHIYSFPISFKLNVSAPGQSEVDGEGVSSWMRAFDVGRAQFRQVVGYLIWFSFSFMILRLYLS